MVIREGKSVDILLDTIELCRDYLPRPIHPLWQARLHVLEILVRTEGKYNLMRLDRLVKQQEEKARNEHSR